MVLCMHACGQHVSRLVHVILSGCHVFCYMSESADMYEAVPWLLPFMAFMIKKPGLINLSAALGLGGIERFQRPVLLPKVL